VCWDPPNASHYSIAPRRRLHQSGRGSAKGNRPFRCEDVEAQLGLRGPRGGCGTVPSTGRRLMPFMRAGKLRLEILNDPSESRSRFIPYPQPHDNKQNLVRYRRTGLRADSLGALARSTARVNCSGTCRKMSPRCDSGSIVAARFKRGLIQSLVRR